MGLNVDAAHHLSNPQELERILRQVVEVPGRENVYRYVYVGIQVAHLLFLRLKP